MLLIYLRNRCVCVFALACFALVLLALVLPLSAIIGTMAGIGGISPLKTANAARIASACRYTIFQAFFSAVFASILALPGAFFCARRILPHPAASCLEGLSVIPFCLPPILIALGFSSFYGASLYGGAGRWGIVFIHGAYNFPIILTLVCAAWKKMPSQYEQSAASLGAGKTRIFVQITLPYIANPLAVSFLLVFIYSFFSFVIVMLFGRPGSSTLETELYKYIKTDFNLQGGALIAFVETALILPVLFLYAHFQDKTTKRTGVVASFRTELKALSALEKALFALYAAAVFAVLLAPLFSVFVKAFRNNGAYFVAIFTYKTFLSALRNSLVLALCVSVISASAGTFFSLALFLRNSTSRKSKAKLLSALPLLPLAFSSVTLGLGYLLLDVKPQMSILCLAAAQSSVAWLFTAKQVSFVLEQLPSSVHDAAAIFSASTLDSVFRVYLPLCKSAIAGGAAFAFAISMGECALPMLLSGANFDLLSVFVYRLASSYRFAEGCAAGIILTLTSLLGFFISRIRVVR